jgi:hypothetical protein
MGTILLDLAVNDLGFIEFLWNAAPGLEAMIPLGLSDTFQEFKGQSIKVAS